MALELLVPLCKRLVLSLHPFVAFHHLLQLVDIMLDSILLLLCVLLGARNDGLIGQDILTNDVTFLLL